jgi:acetyl-CoA C-acetyltransferase
MPDAVIVAACRTAIGTARRGTLVDADPFDMASVTLREAVARLRAGARADRRGQTTEV